MTKQPERRIWEGVFPTYADAKAVGSGFSGETWINRSAERAREVREACERGEDIDPGIKSRNAYLCTFLKTLLEKRSSVRVLDFGGGLGFGYLAALAEIKQKSCLEYHIVETPASCAAGKDIYRDGGLQFHESVPSDLHFDLVYTSSTLQYIEDWRSVLGEMLRSKPDFFLASDVIAGDFPAYASLQEYYGSKIAYWFLNIKELVCEIEGNNYDCVEKTSYQPHIFNQDMDFPMDNFPEELRVAKAQNLLFAYSLANR